MPAVGRLAAFQSRPFALYWAGFVVSYTGVRATVAANLWQLLQLTDSALFVGAVGLAEFAALLLLTPLGGVLADRLERRALLQASQAVAAVISLALALGTWLDVVQPWHIYAAVALSSAAVTFDLPVRQALIPSLVPPAALVSALALTTPVFPLAGLIGPSLAGIVIAAGGTAPVYLLDALGHLLLVAVLFGLRTPAALQPAAVTAPFVSSFVEGVRFVRERPILWQLMLLDFVTTLFAAYRALLPVIARDVLLAGPVGYGLLTSAVSAGAVLGGAAMIRLGWAGTSGALVLASTAGYAAVVALLGQAQLLVLALVATAVLGFLDSVSVTVRATLVQLETPNELRGRVGALAFMLARGGPALGQTLLGGAASALGIPVALALGALVPLAASGGLLGFGRSLRSYRGASSVKLRADA